MHLKRLELVGFKSFVQKTTLEFPKGITAIVGPNGSGKSNVIDAIRWLLGERDAKNIRGAKAEDLIFAGTPQRARAGMGQATLIFDNSSGFFPVEYNEVSVRRQVTRDGTSHYFLNGDEMRLKDMIDFFAKARLGTKGLTIINQGNSDIFVKATPKERRVMVEEALGLRQYQLKKHDAELKLNNAEINLEKVAAMLEELKPHLRLLRRQAGRWEKQADLEKELRAFEAVYFGGKLHELAEAEAALAPRMKAVDKAMKEKKSELAELQKELAKVEASAPKGDEGFNNFKERQNELLQRRATLQNMIGRLEAHIELLAKQPANVEGGAAVRMLEEIRDMLEGALHEEEIESLHQLLQKVLEDINGVLEGGGGEREEQAKELEENKKEIAAELAKIDSELVVLSERESQFAGNLRGFNALFKKAFEAVEAKKDEINKLEVEKNRIAFDQERITIKRQELEHTAQQSGRKLAEFSPQKSELGDDSERRMFKLRGELASIGDIDPALMKEAQETEGRFTFLSTQKEDLEKAVKDLRGLIKELDEKIHREFSGALKKINEQFSHYFGLMFGGGKASMKLEKPEPVRAEMGPEEVAFEELEDIDERHAADHGGIEVSIAIPRKKIRGLDMLSGGERSLVSIAALFALVSVSPPPFLVLDEVDAPLDERNARRFANLVKDFAAQSQFILVTHNRATMEAADVLYGVTMGNDGTSKVLSLKLESEETVLQ